MADPIKKQAVKTVEKGEKLRVPTASEEYHAKKDAKEAKRYGGFGRGGTGKNVKEESAARVAKMASITKKMRSKRQARSPMPTMGGKKKKKGFASGFAKSMNR
jgi:hypothetical protein